MAEIMFELDFRYDNRILLVSYRFVKHHEGLVRSLSGTGLKLLLD